jgi:hypothetical protein
MSKPAGKGGPAFPCGAAGGCGPWDGMSLRDWFAGQALSGRTVQGMHDTWADLATDVYEIADAMLAERNKESE